jgi:hypothetical protein
MKTGQLRIGKGSYGQIKTKINRIGSDGRVYTWKKKGESLSDRTTTPTVKSGGGNNLMVWGCMG